MERKQLDREKTRRQLPNFGEVSGKNMTGSGANRTSGKVTPKTGRKVESSATIEDFTSVCSH